MTNTTNLNRVENALVRDSPGIRHRLCTMPCGHCERPMFRYADGQKCPGKPEFRPPVSAGTFSGKWVCPKCWRMLKATAKKPPVPRRKAGEVFRANEAREASKPAAVRFRDTVRSMPTRSSVAGGRT